MMRPVRCLVMLWICLQTAVGFLSSTVAVHAAGSSAGVATHQRLLNSSARRQRPSWTHSERQSVADVAPYQQAG